jgi:DNA-binding transcriptional LysR family regulator
MDLNAAAMFVAVVRAGSLSAAAAQLKMPLATLSRRVRQLEETLRLQLLERSTRGVKLTEAGARLFDGASKGVEMLAEAEQAAHDAQTNLQGRLRLSIPPAFEIWWPLLSGFQRQYPDIQVSVQVTERRVDLVQDGVDVALRIGDLEDDSVVARRLLNFRHVLVAAPDLIRRLGEPSKVGQLKNYPCAGWAISSSSRVRWPLAGDWVDVAPVLSTNDYAHLRHGAEAAEFITELPEFLARPALEQGRLKQLLVSRPFPVFSVQLLYLSHRHPSTIVRAYLDYCTTAAEAIVGG